MGPKKKKKGNKLARMSEEERLRYLQHRAAMEEENKRRKEQLISTFMKSKMKHEDAFTRLNSFKINQQWRQTLRRIKNKELFDITESMRQQFEVALETKNKIIDTLLANLYESETQYSIALQAHLEAIDRLIAIHEGRLKEIHSRYLKDREALLNYYIKGKVGLFVEHHETKEFLETVIYLSQKNKDDCLDNLNKQATNKYDESYFQLLFEKRLMEEKGNSQISKVNEEIQKVLKEYSQKTKPIEPFYNALVKVDRQNRNEYRKREKIIKNFVEQITTMKKDYAQKKHDHKFMKINLEKQIEQHKNKFDELRKSEKIKTHQAQERITTLSIFSNRVIQELQKLDDKAKTIHSLFSKCQQYLTEKEKLIPSYSTEKTEHLSKGEISLVDQMKHFWQRYNEVTLELGSLRVYHSNYKLENRQLKYLLKQYLSTLSWPSSVPTQMAQDQA